MFAVYRHFINYRDYKILEKTLIFVRKESSQSVELFICQFDELNDTSAHHVPSRYVTSHHIIGFYQSISAEFN